MLFLQITACLPVTCACERYEIIVVITIVVTGLER
jgi:hypothetical protein